MKAEIHSSIATARHFLGFATDHCRAILNVALSSMSGGQVQSPAGAIAMEKQTQVERNWRFALLVLATGLLVGGIVQPVAAKDCNTFDCDIEWDERLLMPRNYNAVNKGQLEAEPTGGYIYRRNRFVAPPGTSANAFETCAGVKTWHPQHVVRLPNKDGRAYFMVAQSGRQGGWISLLQTAPDAIDSDDLLKDGAGGLYVWSDNYGRNSGNPAGAYNHPGKMEVIGGLLLVAAQDWITDLMITCDAIDNDGDILGRYGSLDAILFYDIRDPQYPKYLGKLDTEQLGIDPIDLPGDDVFSDFVGGYLRAEIDAVSLFRSPRDEWFLRIGGGGDAQLSKRVLKAKVGARADCGATSTLRGLPWLFEECPSQPQDGRIDGITAAYGMTFNSLNLGGGDSGTPGEVGLFWVYEEMKDTVCSIAGLCLEYSLFPIARWKWTEYGLEGQPEDEYLIGVDPRQRTDGFLVLDDLDGDSNGLWNTPSVYVTREGMPVIYAMRNYADPDAAGTLYQAHNQINLDTAASWAHLLHPDRVVTTCADSGVGSLRNAIGYGGNITFDLPPECNNTIQLTNGALVVYLYDVDIDATSAGGVTIVGGVPPIRDSLGGCTFGTMCPHLDARVFRIAKDINVTMSRLTITGGRAQQGAGIFNAGTLSLNDSTVTENTAQGYYYNPDSPTLIVRENYNPARGAGIFNTVGGVMTLNRSAVVNNQIICSQPNLDSGDETFNCMDGVAVLESSTITLLRDSIANSDSGAGIYNVGFLEIDNSTIAGNSAVRSRGGVGIVNAQDGQVHLQFSTVAGNVITQGNTTAEFTREIGVGIANLQRWGDANERGYSVSIQSSIVAYNRSVSSSGEYGSDVAGPFDTVRDIYGLPISIVQTPYYFTGGALNPIKGAEPWAVDPMLAPLGNWGGATPSMLPRFGSPAIDIGGRLWSVYEDQRGYQRPGDRFVTHLGSGEDAGSVEVIPIDHALGSSGLTWIAAGGSEWYGQQEIVRTGDSAMQSSPVPGILRANVTGPGVLRFHWKVSSGDRLELDLDDNIGYRAAVSGVDWQQETVAIPAGQHTLTWAYETTATDFPESHAAWLDDVTFSIPPVLSPIGDKQVDEEFTLSFTATATDSNAVPSPLTFTLGAGAPPGATITSAGEFSWTPTVDQGPGSYPITVVVSNSYGDTDSETISIGVHEVFVLSAITLDDTPGSLRELIATVPTRSTIRLAPGLAGQVITLVSGPLVIDKDLVIDAPGLTLSANNLSRVLDITAPQARVTLKGLTVTAGYADVGGCIRNAGTLSIIDTEVTGCRATSVSGGISYGGGIYNFSTIGSGGNLNVVSSTVAGNTSAHFGGGIASSSGTVRLSNTTIANNEAQYAGGGLAFGLDGVPVGVTVPQTVTLVHTTISGNRVTAGSYRGGGITCFSTGSGSFTVEHVIIAGNTALNGQDVGSAAACSLDPLVVSGTSLIGENEAGYWAEAFPDGSLVGTPDTPLNADLLPLGDYGGPTRTMLPLVGSPAVDNATGGTSLLTEDQRHEVRPLGSFRDLGAVEGTVSKIDSDGDGFADVDENCPTISNPDQSENPCLPLTNSADDGSVGSLRDIISRALPGHVITFDPALMSGGTITLNGTPLQIEKALTIDASNLPGGLTLSGNDVSRIFSIYSSIYGDVVVELRGLTITGGADNQGGCIYNSGGTGESLSIFDSTITGCIAKRGGGIYSTGALAIVNSTISGNRVNNTISFGPYDGGGILATGPLTLVHSTVTDNHAGPIIGASSSRGGGIRASGLTTIENSIIAGNTAATEGDDLWLSGTIIASGANLIGDNSGAEATFPAGPLVGTKASPLNPVLAPLGNYGGSSQTMVPLPGSPAIDAAIVTGNSPATDQRGVVRPQGAANDLGATERKADDVNPDTDGDGVADAIDNCPAVSNPLQTDSNGNGDGDACDVSVPPVVEAGPGGIVDEADLFSSAGTVTDSDSGNWTASVDYGDGSGAQTLLINSAGSFALAHTYVDNGNYTITVNVADDQGNVGAGTASVTVNNVSPTVDAGLDQTANEGQAIAFGGNYSDPGPEDTHTATWDFGDGSGPVTGALDTFHIYSRDGTYTATLTVTDDDAGVGSDSVSVVVNNVPPIALNDTFSTDEDTGLTIPASGVLANDSDAGADSLTAKMTTGASNGSVALNPDGSFTYTPNENFNGVDSFVYVANDGDADSTNATVSITVNPVNDAPVTTDDAYSVDEDTILTIPAPGMLVNDTDVDGDTVMLETFNSPNHGTLSIGGDGAFSYTPNPDFNGVDTFGYVATDLQGGTDNGTVTITVLPVNDAPEAVNDNAITNEEFPAMISVMANDSDLDGDAISITSSTNGTYGTTTTDGSSVTYTPIANFHGIDNYSYEICDNGVPQRCDVAMVSVTVLSVNDMPAAFDDSATTNEDTTITIDVLVNDSDLDGDSIAVSGSTDGTHGTTTTDGSAVSYKPELNFNGNDSFSYTMCDNGTPQLCNKATVSVTVNPVNDSPTVSADPAPASAQYSDPLSVTISGDDVDSTALSIVTSTLPAGLSLSAANCAVGSPPVDCEWTISGNVEASPGVYSVTATVTDNGEATDATPQSTSTTFEITVDPEDARATYTGPLFLGSAEDGSFTVNLKATIRDVTAVDAANDPNAGDIRKVSVEFVNAAGASLCKPPSVSLVFNGDETVGSASCSYSGRLGDNEEELPLEVTTVVNGHYVDNSDNEVVVFVVRPGEGKITGGGQLEMINSAGVYAADPVLPTNYGFGAQTVTTGKNNIQYRGRVTVIVRAADGHKYKIKSNAVLSLGVNLDPDGDGDVTTVPHYAEFESKANLADVTDPLNPVALGGNLLLQLRMTDNGEPGELDSISLTLWDGGTLLFSSNWDGSRSVEQNVARGNLKVQ